MTSRTLRLLCGATAPLILPATAQSGFVGLTTTHMSATVYETVNLYAVFDRPGEDLFLAAAGTPGIPMNIEVIGGTFMQITFGGDGPPLAALIPVFPSVANDTFVTIGVAAVGLPPGGQSPDNLLLGDPWPGFEPSSLGGTSIGWAVMPDDPQADRFNPDYVAGNGSVLIGRFSTMNGSAICGHLALLVVSNSELMLVEASFSESMCYGDVDEDETVDIIDMLLLLSSWGPCSNGVCPGDLNGDGIVAVTDFLGLLTQWGPCP